MTARTWLRLAATGLLVSAAAAVMAAVGTLTLFRARGLYHAMARATSCGVLRLHGITLRVHRPYTLPACQTIFVSNHSSTLDLFVLVSGLPRCRFFLSGFLRKILPLGVISWLLGTFFTVPQDRPRERVRIFQRADRVLRRTRESVYLSPEGGRVTTGAIGPFNKGAFHLATSLGAPIVPVYIRIPPAIDPRRGFDAGAGVVDLFFLPIVDTRDWTLGDLRENAASVRRVLAGAHQELSCVT
jgi:1-acyl-sn-glycerol-3-phosphate acyltransferase